MIDREYKGRLFNAIMICLWISSYPLLNLLFIILMMKSTTTMNMEIYYNYNGTLALSLFLLWFLIPLLIIMYNPFNKKRRKKV